MAKQSKFVYRGDKRTVESVVRKSKQSGGAFDSYLLPEAQLLKIGDGESTIRIMPPSWAPEDDEKWGDGWDIQVFLHYSVGPDNATYLCLDKMKGEPCPVCDARRDATDDERDQMKPQGRFLCWAIDRNNEKAGPQVWSMPVTVLREIAIRSVDKKHNTPIPIDDPEEGYDVVFSRDGKGIKTKYSAFEVLRDASPLHDNEELQDRWLDYISDHPLPDVLQFYDAEHIEGVLFGRAERGSSDDAERDTGSTRRRSVRDDDDGKRKPARRGSSDDEADYLDEDDEPKKPERTRSGGRSKPDEDSDDDPPFDDDRPARRRRGEPKDDEVDDSKPTRGRRDPDPDDGAEEPDADEDDPSTSTRNKLEAMKRRRSRR